MTPTPDGPVTPAQRTVIRYIQRNLNIRCGASTRLEARAWILKHMAASKSARKKAPSRPSMGVSLPVYAQAPQNDWFC